MAALALCAICLAALAPALASGAASTHRWPEGAAAPPFVDDLSAQIHQLLLESPLPSVPPLTDAQLAALPGRPAAARVAAAAPAAYLANVNALRAASLPLPGASWSTFYALHPRSTQPMVYLATGGGDPGDGRAALDVLRGALAAGKPINWPKWEAAGGGEWLQTTALLSLFMQSRDPRYVKTFASLAADYCANHRRQVVAAQAAAGVEDAQYSRNAGWVLGQASQVLPQIMLVLAGFLKVADQPAMDRPTLVAAWGSGAFMRAARPPLAAPAAAGVLREAQLTAIRRGLFVDHTDYLIQAYKFTGRVPNQRLEGLSTLVTMGALFKDFCAADTAAVRYTVWCQGEAKSFTRLSDVAANAYADGLAGLQMQMDEEYWADGAVLERSSNYNRGQVGGLRDVRLMVPPAARARVDAIVAGYAAWEDGLRMPNGDLPPVGNVPPLGAGDGGGPPPGTPSAVFPRSGYAALRGEGDQYMFVNFGVPSRGHQIRSIHYLVFYALGRVHLTTGGPPTYGFDPGANARRASFLDEACSFKANAWVVDNLNLAAAFTYPPFGWAPLNATSARTLGVRALRSAAFDVVEHSFWARFGGSYGAGVVGTEAATVARVQRVVIVHKARATWYVADRIVPEDAGAAGAGVHEYRHPWNLPADLHPADVALFRDGFATRRAGGPNLRVWHDAAVRTELYHGQYASQPIRVAGLASTPVRSNLGPLGWSASGIGAMEPAVNVHTVLAASGPVALLTVLQAAAEGAPAAGAAPAWCQRLATGVRCTHGAVRLQVAWEADAAWDGLYDGAKKTQKLAADGPLLRPPAAAVKKTVKAKGKDKAKGGR